MAFSVLNQAEDRSGEDEDAGDVECDHMFLPGDNLSQDFGGGSAVETAVEDYRGDDVEAGKDDLD
jgi:hypothetical protein